MREVSEEGEGGFSWERGRVEERRRETCLKYPGIYTWDSPGMFLVRVT